MTADFPCRFTPCLPKASFTLLSDCWHNLTKNGFSCRKAFHEKRFPQSHNCRLHLWMVFSAWHLGEDRRKAFFEDCQQPGDLFWCQDEQNESLSQNERLSLASPYIDSMPASVVSKSVSICLRVQCGWEAWENRQIHIYIYVHNGLRQQLILSLHNITGLDSICPQYRG